MTTDIFILVVTTAIIAFDVWLIAKGKPSISRKMNKHGSAVHAVPFLWGSLLGHFWLGNLVPWRLHIAISLGALAVLAVAVSFAGKAIGGKRLVVLWGFLGIAAGGVLWPL